MLKLFLFMAMLLILTAGYCFAQTEPSEETSQNWLFSASVYTYLVPDDQDYAQPTFTADHHWLHLEARYNYEGLRTGSAWIGYNFSVGETLYFELTPMVGAVFSDTDGVAPGYKFTLGYKKFEMYSESEYVFDTNHHEDSFFYTWLEITYSPKDWFRFGAVIQRTKDYHTDFDIQRGPIVGFAIRRLDLTLAVLNPEDPTVAFSAGVSF